MAHLLMTPSKIVLLGVEVAVEVVVVTTTPTTAAVVGVALI
jgi:hypothetical protein